ncbi:hypothetical protein LL14B4_10530 [Lactococcus lactis subsp. lactis]|uniref:Uncharacterized protein n=1 Tax=Lactococcus lactis subsp. lactis TaxID=1360 RepID=A0A2Z3KGG1_LACLL|nr:hypothetical protein [Lactococcus lactis]AWN66587.1 hypothetical protein LL14B4_10530 [Lactococcus lactis subsp. lactis]
MNRTEITASLSELVRKRLENRSIFWAAEVNLDAHKKRVDFVGFNPSKNGNFANIAEIESGTFDFYEVKSSMADFNSGHGKNWEGDNNFLVCEKELANELHQKMLLPHNVDVLCPNKSRTALIPTFSGHWASRRTKSVSELLWTMICSRDARYIKRMDEMKNE